MDTVVEVSRHDRDGDVRGNALFWLAESDSDLAYDYVDRLLSSSRTAGGARR